MAADRPTSLQWAEYLAARLVASGANTIGFDTTMRWARSAGRLLYKLDKPHRDRALWNLRLSFPEKSDQELARIASQSFINFFRLALEGLNTPRLINADSWPRRVVLRDMSKTVDLLNSDKPLLLITGHFGNWEVIGSLLAVIGYQIDAVARPIDNRLINRWLLSIRERRGLTILSKGESEIERMISAIQTGRKLGLVADQNAGDRGMFVPFFGRMASTHKSIGLMAVQYNVTIVCGGARRIGNDSRFELLTTDIISPDEWANEKDPLFYVTARYMRAIEDMVEADPDQYLWLHRRWKSRPRYEKQGKPMPSALRHKLESLPWMTQDELHRLLVPPPVPEWDKP